ncbi:MAG TPA: DUF4380 domain-containing protein [Bacteroidales bacterium]|nr:DUF4380 domain-containing protein [Bacteroidales bacterium]
MKNLKLLVGSLIAVYFCSCTREPAKYSQVEHKISSLQLPHKVLGIDHNYGARIVMLRYYGQELLCSPTVNEENFGSTFWPSPQSDWGWPPIATLDKLPYSITMNGTEIQYYSKPDKKSGLQVGKFFRINPADSSFVINYIIKNISQEDKLVAPWEVTRRIAGGMCFFPAGPDSVMMKKSNLPGVTVKDGIVWFDYDSAKITADSKLYAFASGGWLANVKDSILFLKTFADINDSQLPPGQGEIEIYANKEKQYVELENHGEYTSLFPGDSLTYNMNWILKGIPENIDKSVGSKELVNWVRMVVFRNKYNMRKIILNSDF